MSVDILGTSCDQCRSMVQCSFTSTESRRLVRTDSPGRPPRLSHSSTALVGFTIPGQNDQTEHFYQVSSYVCTIIVCLLPWEKGPTPKFDTFFSTVRIKSVLFNFVCVCGGGGVCVCACVRVCVCVFCVSACLPACLSVDLIVGKKEVWNTTGTVYPSEFYDRPSRMCSYFVTAKSFNRKARMLKWHSVPFC